MGIKGLPKLIEDIAGKGAINSYPFSRFKGMTIAVDASLMMHQTVIAIRGSGKDMTNNRGELTSHLHGFLYKIITFVENGIVPIFVFDGKPPDIKLRTLERRSERKEQAEESIKGLSEEDEEYIKNFKMTFRPSKKDYKEVQILLDLLGIPYIISPGEADVVCAWLTSRRDNNGHKYAKGVCSDDSDMLPLGASYLFKDMLKFMSKNKPVKVISLNKTLVKMNLTMDQFIDLSVLLGCDYCENVKGVGPKTAYKLISEHGSLKKVLKLLSRKHTDLDTECMFDAENYFKNATKELDESDDFVITDDNLKLRQFQFEEVMDFMCIKHNFDITKMQTAFKRLELAYKNMEITRPNTKKVHKIIQPRSTEYLFRSLEDRIEFLSSDEESEEKNKIISKPTKKSVSYPEKKKT